MMNLNGKKNKSNNINVYRNILVLSLAACLNFTGFSSLQNLQSSFNPSLGFTTLCILYATYAITLLFLPNLVIYKIGYKWTFVVSVVGYATFTLVQFFPSSIAMSLAAVCVGKSVFLLDLFRGSLKGSTSAERLTNFATKRWHSCFDTHVQFYIKMLLIKTLDWLKRWIYMWGRSLIVEIRLQSVYSV